MFETEHVKSYLQKVDLGADGDKRTAKCLFYITPIHYDLAKEFSSHVADRLFRKLDGEWAPCSDLTRANFDIRVPTQRIAFCRDPQLPNSGGVILDAKVSGIHALKLFTDQPTFTLAFSASFEIHDKQLASLLCIDLLKQDVYLTTGAMEPVLPFDDLPQGHNTRCATCNEPAEYIGDDGSAWCPVHVHAAVGVTIRKLGKPPDPGEGEAEESEAAPSNGTGRKKKAKNKAAAKK